MTAQASRENRAGALRRRSMKEAWEAAASAVCKGTLIAFDRDGRPLVRVSGAAQPLCCDVLDTGMGVPELRLGQELAVARYAHDDDMGCVLGRVASPAEAGGPVRRSSLKLEVGELIVNARDLIALGTESARVRLDKQGDLQLVASSIISRARKLQKLLAPMLRLN